MEKASSHGGQGAGMRATFDMWLMEYERLNDLLKASSTLFLSIRQEPLLILNLYEVLNEIWRILRPLAVPGTRVKMDGELTKIRNLAFKEHGRVHLIKTQGMLMSSSLKEDVITEFDKFYNSLLDFRQKVGMGVKATREVSDKQKMKRSVGGV